MDTEDAERLAAEKSNDELLLVLANPGGWQEALVNAAELELSKRGIEINASVAQRLNAFRAENRRIERISQTLKREKRPFDIKRYPVEIAISVILLGLGTFAVFLEGVESVFRAAGASLAIGAIGMAIGFGTIVTKNTYGRPSGRLVESESWNDGIRGALDFVREPLGSLGLMLLFFGFWFVAILAGIGGWDLYRILRPAN